MKKRPEQVAALAHLAALALLWRHAAGGWPSLVALLLMLVPVPARRRRAQLLLGAGHVMAAIFGTLGEVVAAHRADSGGVGLAVALARGLVLAGAAGSRRNIAATGGAFVGAPVAVAVLCAASVAPGATITDVLCALTALGAAVAAAAIAHDERSVLAMAPARARAGAGPQRPVFGLSLAHAGLTAAFFCVALAFRDEKPREAAPVSPIASRASRQPAIGLSSDVLFDGTGAPTVREPTVVATLKEESSRGIEQGLFLRATALERIDDDGFHPPMSSSEASDTFALREIDRIEAPRPLRLEVELTGVASGFLLQRGTALGLERARAARDAAGNLHLAADVTPPVAYTLRAVECLDAEGLLQARDPAEAPGLLELPASLADDRDLRALAARFTRGAASPYGKARSVERRLAGEFDYDLASTHRTRGIARTVRRFLLEEKRGACTEFATAMVVLLRLAGVPSRLVLGYHVDANQRDAEGLWTVHEADAHAWVEVPLKGAGFVTYDPTAPVRDGPVPPPEDKASEETPAAGVPAAARLSRRTALVLALGILATVGAGVSLLHVLAAASRRQAQLRPKSGDLAPELVSACAALFALAERKGFVLGGAETLLAFATGRASREGAGATEKALVRAVKLYYAVRFSGRKPSARSLDRLRELVEAASA
ncbi:MAG TPA: transglutaminase-like domain-containing protein [Planctomycetota bacterium]|nr:transglutaminase-like domain-containing protein [Planctomycetota bacterium]